jgi:hypothetical protein
LQNKREVRATAPILDVTVKSRIAIVPRMSKALDAAQAKAHCYLAKCAEN